MTATLGKLSRFDLLEQIAASPFALVYRARDPETASWVAVKVCVVADQALRKRFLSAAERAATLSHPHIARILEFGSGGGRPYLVEEFLSGPDLRQLVPNLRASPGARELAILVQIARALQYAHRQGVAHQDLKPATVHLEAHDEVKLVDFGIARLATAVISLYAPEQPPATSGYLAPEQALGLPADERTDLFCFGALAWELLARRSPFAGATTAELARETLQAAEVAPLSTLWPACPAELEALVARCLAKSPGERYAGFDDLLLDLIPILEAVRIPGWLAQRSLEDSDTEALNPVSSLDDTVAIPLAQIAALTSGDPGEATLADRLATAVLPSPAPPSPLTGVTMPLPTEELPASARAQAAPVDPAPTAQAAAAVAPSRPMAPPPEPTRPEMVRPALAARGAPAGAPGPAPTRSRKGLKLALASAAALAVMLLGVLAVIQARDQAPPTLPAPATPPVPAATPARVVPTYPARFDAAPWAELISLTDAGGKALALPAERHTPVALFLPAGRYTGLLRHPGSATPLPCQLEVKALGPNECQVEARRVDVDEYFQRAGWWR
ncbi:MAG TPA: serine/threonine-protein kinase [Thermoanaerobaculia bacterium]|nr:serine/threonine-protein kinase [Thermoanaerobaculia bacterium]